MKYLLVVVLAVIFVQTCTTRAHALDGWYTMQGVADVRDGDGVDIGGVSVDLYGLNSPGGFTSEGIKVTDYLVELLQGRQVQASCTDNAAATLRPRCFIAIDGFDIGLRLIDKGMAEIRFPTMSIYLAAYRNVISGTGSSN